MNPQKTYFFRAPYSEFLLEVLNKVGYLGTRYTLNYKSLVWRCPMINMKQKHLHGNLRWKKCQPKPYPKSPGKVVGRGLGDFQLAWAEWSKAPIPIPNVGALTTGIGLLLRLH